MLEALLWIILGAFGLSPTACGFWAALDAAVLEADPDGTLHTGERSLAEQLVVTANAAEWAISIDHLGPREWRALTGVPPAPFPQAIAILGRAQADVAERWRHASALAATLPRRVDSARDPTATPSTLSRVVEDALGSLATAARESFAPDHVAPPARQEDPSPAAAAITHLAAAHAAAVAAHVEVRHLLVRTTIWSLVAITVAAVVITFVGSTVVAVSSLSPPLPPPTSLPMTPGRHAVSASARRPSKTDPVLVEALTTHLVPASLARDLAARFSQAPHTPGSLTGHDCRAGGLVAHALTVVTAINRLTRGAPRRDRTLAATLAASHDLGKLLTYREDASGTWTAHSAVPHDSLGAQVLALCPSLRRAFAAAEVEDLLLALHTEHAPDLVPSNARPRVQQLRRWLREADAVGAAQGSPPSIAVASTSEATEDTTDA